MSTITGTTISGGITLGTSGFTSPLTITSTGAVEASTGNAIYSPGTLGAVTVLNQGTITAPSDGVRLLKGGYVDNAGGLIEGSTGVYITGTAGSVTNSGTLLGTAGSGVNLSLGGYVDNAAGLIKATYGIYVNTAAGTITNTATIVGTGANGIGIDLRDGGSVSNTGTVDGTNAGIDITGATGKVVNSGTIAATGNARDGINLYGGGSVTNNTGGVIAGSGLGGAGVYIGERGLAVGLASAAVTNAGTIEGPGGAGVNINLQLGASVGNTGLITAFGGVYIVAGTAGTVTNSGTIIGTGGSFGGGKGVGFEEGDGNVDNIAGLIEGNAIGVQVARAGTVTNSGTILSGNIVGTSAYGVEIQLGGVVVNNTGGVIQGYKVGVYIYGSAGTVANSGIIDSTGTGREAIRMKNGGSVSNSGSITGQTFGVYIFGGAGTVTNSGTIDATGSGGVGIVLFNGGTVVDSGEISGGARAIYFAGIAPDLLVLGHGYHLSGAVYGGFSLNNTVELAGSVSSALTVGYNGLGLTHFSNALFGAGGYDTLQVGGTSGTLPLTVSGFTLTSDIVDLTTIGTNGSITGQSGTAVTVTGSLGSETLKLDLSDATHFTVTSDGTIGTDLGVACFLRGTLILTENGEVAAEDLAIGDRVVTFSGEAKPIKWIGQRAYDGRFVAANRAVLPIRIEAGALGERVPARDLWVSPEHALLIPGSSPGTGALVPAALLTNGATIRQVEEVDRVEYFHIELETHDVILAEGAPAESFVDCDNRFMFQNGAEFAALYPDDAPVPWQFCAPRVEPGAPELLAVRQALADRAATLGYRLTDDPDLHLVADGAIVRAQSVGDGVYSFSIPAGSSTIWLASHSAVPAQIEAASRDTRRLGVPLRQIVLRDDDLRIDISHRHASLCEGFHEDEGSHRWTDGMAHLPEELLRAFAGTITAELHVSKPGLRYPLAPPVRTRAAGHASTGSSSRAVRSNGHRIDPNISPNRLGSQSGKATASLA